MKISTKKGDNGKTTLLSGRKVDKDDMKIEAVGVLDELVSFLGLAKSIIKCRRRKNIVNGIQKDLFIMGSELAVDEAGYFKLKKKIDSDKISSLERLIISFEKKYKVDSFYYPGKNDVSGRLNVCRAVSRRLERRAVGLKKKKLLNNNRILIYLNRLSDLLFLLARSFE